MAAKAALYPAVLRRPPGTPKAATGPAALPARRTPNGCVHSWLSPARFIQGQFDDEDNGPVGVICRIHPAIVSVDQVPTDCQTQAAAGNRQAGAAGAAIKGLKHAMTIVCGNAGTAVGNAYSGKAGALTDIHANGLARRGKLDGVGNQVIKRGGQHVGIGANGQW